MRARGISCLLARNGVSGESVARVSLSRCEIFFIPLISNLATAVCIMFARDLADGR
jgi:hypothetical protein